MTKCFSTVSCDVDAQEAFELMCESELGMSGMRLDLFINGYTPRKS